MYTLPLISIQRTGLTKNNERLTNVNNEIKYRTHSKALPDYNLFTPVPVDISYQVTIISKYQEHIDKAISNLLPFFNKDLFVRCEHPKFEGISYTNQIIMDDTITEEAPGEFDNSQDDIRTCVLNFTMKTFLFCDNKKAIKVPRTRKEISSVISSFVYELTEKDKTHIEDFLDTPLSTTLTVETTTYVDVPISGETEISGFTPQINTIYFGFYPTPTLSQYVPYINWVDSLDKTPTVVSGDYSNVDLSVLSTLTNTTDTYHNYDPYVDYREDIFVIGID